MENMIDFDYSKQVADMWRINRAIGRCLECRDAERNKISRRKMQRSEKRKNDFRAAKRRYDFCVSKGINDKKMSETSMKKGFRHGSYHDNSDSHYAKNKNKAPSKNFSMSVYRREYDAKEKMTEYLYGLYEEKAERADTMSFWMEQDDGAIFYNELVDFIRQVCCATDEEISDCGIVEMMVIAYQLGEAKRFGINEDDVTVPRVTRDDWGDPITQYKPIRLHNTAQKLLNRGWADNYTAIEDNQWWEDFCDFDCGSL